MAQPAIARKAETPDCAVACMLQPLVQAQAFEDMPERYVAMLHDLSSVGAISTCFHVLLWMTVEMTRQAAPTQLFQALQSGSLSMQHLHT